MDRCSMPSSSGSRRKTPLSPKRTTSSPQMRTYLTYLAALESWDLERVADQLHDTEFQHQVLPNRVAKPVLDKKQFLMYLELMKDMFNGYKAKIHDLQEGPNTIWAHITSHGESSTGRPYASETMSTIYFSKEENPKIIGAKEFVDSQYWHDFYKEERRRMSGPSTPIISSVSL